MEGAYKPKRNRRVPESELRSRAQSERRPVLSTPLFPSLRDLSAAVVSGDESSLAGDVFGPSSWARMARAVGLTHEAPVIVALSGGADSVYLLRIVAAARPRPRLCVVHIEHGLRGAEGIADGRFCERLCNELDVPFLLRRLELEANAPSLEARAREGRYRALCEEAARLSIRTILTGHHADDALETLLQRWLRGTDLHGLAGLQTRLRLPARSSIDSVPSIAGKSAARRRSTEGPGRARSSDRAGGIPSAVADEQRLNTTDHEVEIIRPLIALRREEVRQTLRERDIEWREDGSNASPRFTRNRVRTLLLPEIERTCGPSGVENLRAFGRAVETLEERCAELTAGITWAPPAFAAACRGLNDTSVGGTLERSRLVDLSPTLQRRALWRLLAEGSGHAPARSHLNALLADLAAGRCRRHSLRGGWSVQLRSRLLHLEPPILSKDAGTAGANREIAPMDEMGSPQLAFPFADDAGASRSTIDPSSVGSRLEIPGIVVLDDGRCIAVELLEVPAASEIPRSPVCIELDARDIRAPLSVRRPRTGDRFHALGAPGTKSLGRFFSDIGLPFGDRGRVPLVFAGRELVWVAGIRPCHDRRIRPDTRERLRLTLHPTADALFPGSSFGP